MVKKYSDYGVQNDDRIDTHFVDPDTQKFKRCCVHFQILGRPEKEILNYRAKPLMQTWERNQHKVLNFVGSGKVMDKILTRMEKEIPFIWTRREMGDEEYDNGRFEAHVAEAAMHQDYTRHEIDLSVNMNMLVSERWSDTDQPCLRALFAAHAHAHLKNFVSAKVYIIAPQNLMPVTVNMMETAANQWREGYDVPSHRGFGFARSVAYHELGKADHPKDAIAFKQDAINRYAREQFDRYKDANKDDKRVFIPLDNVGWWDMKHRIFISIDPTMHEQMARLLDVDACPKKASAKKQKETSAKPLQMAVS